MRMSRKSQAFIKTEAFSLQAPQVLVEKLLRSCSDVKNIYVLLRTKKGLNARSRLDELLNTKIFEKIRDENPKALNKIVAIQGDITLNSLGISESDLNLLSSDVSIVFHSAATVKFDEPLKTSVEFNVIGTRRLVEICHKMPKLVALIHVSTAYANCNRSEIDELLYSPPVSPQKIVDAVEWMDDEVINSLTPKLLGDRPNTYTYTKALAESLLVDECGSLPVAIVRPSIVTASWKEPLPGWVDNINGPTGLILASGKGILRTMLFNSKAGADLIPVDTVINLMISVAWYTATQQPNSIMVYNCTSGQHNRITWGDIERIAFPLLLHYPSAEIFRYPGGNFKENLAWYTATQQPNSIMVYNCTSGQHNRITWGDIERIAFPLLLHYPSAEIFRYPGGNFKENRLFNDICSFFDHIIPAYFFDALMALTGRKRIMVRIYEKLHRATGALEWFTTREWKFSANNVLMLIDQLKGVDKETFHFDIRDLHWPTYWEDYVLGSRKYILKEDNSSL
ncbi:unnamed protein product, partial [Oppiella nova]